MQNFWIPSLVPKNNEKHQKYKNTLQYAEPPLDLIFAFYDILTKFKVICSLLLDTFGGWKMCLHPPLSLGFDIHHYPLTYKCQEGRPQRSEGDIFKEFVKEK